MVSSSLDDTALLRIRPWREVAILAIVVMELSWVVPWFRSLTPATNAVSPWRALLVLGALFLVTHLLVRLMNFVHLRLDVRRWVIVAWFVLSSLVGIKSLLYIHERLNFAEFVTRPIRAFNDIGGLIPNEFVIVLAVLVAGWRGISLAQEIIGPQAVRRNFQLGILMFLGFVFINTFVTGETPGVFIYLFMFASLLAMGAARISVISSLRGGGQYPFDLRWFLGIILATLVVVGASAVAASFAGGELSVVGRAGALILQVFVIAIFLLLSPLLFILPYLIERLQGASDIGANLLRVLEEMQTLVFGLATQLSDFLERSGLSLMIPRLKPFILWGVVILIGLLAVAVLNRWLTRLRESQAEDRQSLLQRGDLWQLLRQSLQDGLRKMGAGLADLARFRHGQRLLAAARIRRIYAQLMDLSAKLEHPRLAAQTPLEFLPILATTYPGRDDDLDTITRAYLRVRYGELPETRQEVDQVEQAWERVRSLGMELLHEKKKKS
jgi:hypothetical protein